MEFKDTVFDRHSTRDFSNRPVSKEDLTDIINTAKMTPSWANDQIWKVVVATGETLNRIKKRHLSAGYGHAEFPALHRDAMGTQGRRNVRKWSAGLGSFLGSQGGAMGQQSALLFNAPAVVYLLMPSKSSLWSAYDLGAFGQTLMLAAQDKGIDSMPAEEFVDHPRDLHEILGVGDDYQFGMGIGLGYKKDDALINHFRSERMKNDEFVTFED